MDKTLLNNRLIIGMDCVAAVIFIGYIDYITGYEFDILIFYFIPIALSAWFINRSFCNSIIVLCTIAWYCASSLSHEYSTLWFLYWNTAIHFVAFFIIGFAALHIKTYFYKEKQLNQDLSKQIVKHKQMEEELRKARDELDLHVRQRTAELEKANEELRQIPSKLISVQEEERKRLASELHDSIGQTLAAVKFWVEMALKLKDARDGNAALNHLEQFVLILQRSIEETRSIYMGLRPSMLDSKGLLATLEWLRQECMKLYPERHIELEGGIEEEEIPESLKVNIFRIAQEALNNIAKHSKAEWVDISLSKNGGGIELVVSDDGVGTDLDIIMHTDTAKSLGLTSMRERAELTGGSFSIESTPGEGTTIRAYWPIEDEDQLQKGGIT